MRGYGGVNKIMQRRKRERVQATDTSLVYY